MIKNSQIPQSWKIAKLVDVCEKIVGGGTPSTAIKEYWEGEIPWISSADILGLNKIVPRRKISIKAIENSTTNLLPKGGIIVVTRVGLGKLAIAPCEICFSQDSQGLILNEKLISQAYALICLSKAVQKFKSQSRGTTISGVTKKQLEELEIQLPPLPEQQAIVAKIEELFSSLDKGIESLKTAQQQLKIYRQSVLKFAFEKSATSIPVKLQDVCDLITKGTTPSGDKLFSCQGEVPFLKVYNLTFDGTLNFSKDPTFVTNETHNVFLKRSNVFPGDVLMNIVGPPLGKVSIVPHTYPEWNINQAIARFRCKGSLFNKFLLYFLLSENTIRTYSRKAKATAGQFNLTLEICREIEIPLPSLTEQHIIVNDLESKLTVCDKLEEGIEQSLQQAEVLRQSILKQAFEGKLVPQDDKIIAYEQPRRGERIIETSMIPNKTTPKG